MALDRSYFNTLVDDTGAGDGTPVDVSLIDAIYDDIDALPAAGSSFTAHGVVVGNGTGALAVTSAGTAGQVLTSNGASADPTWEAATGGGAAPTEQTTSTTGTQNDFDLTTANVTLRCTAASAVVFTGFTVATAAPAAGATVAILNIGSSTVRVAHDDSGSTAANRGTFPSARGQILGIGGSMTLVYDGTTSRWRVKDLFPGAPIPIAYNAGDFTASAGTWTVDSGDVLNLAYRQQGRLVTMYPYLVNTSISGGTPGALQIALPNSFTVTIETMAGGIGKDNGTYGPLALYVVAAGTVLKLSLATFASWAASTNNTNCFGTIDFKVD